MISDRAFEEIKFEILTRLVDYGSWYKVNLINDVMLELSKKYDGNRGGDFTKKRIEVVFAGLHLKNFFGYHPYKVIIPFRMSLVYVNETRLSRSYPTLRRDYAT